MAAALGEVAAAIGLLEDAVEQHEEVGDPFGRARALLLSARRAGAPARSGRRARRSRRRWRSSRRSAPLAWAEQARAELGRIGGRTREEGLTPAEQRVAALVAEGRTNREVAAALFLGERTVETHLSHVYAKLGIRSRTELGASPLRLGRAKFRGSHVFTRRARS